MEVLNSLETKYNMRISQHYPDIYASFILYFCFCKEYTHSETRILYLRNAIRQQGFMAERTVCEHKPLK